jgi:superfamily II DNA or RNA helicase
MKYQLRDYQISLINQIYKQWKLGRQRVMAQLPTGGGKTVIFAEIARAVEQRGKRVLVLAHREELILQSAQKIEAFINNKVGIIKAGYKSTSCSIQVASVQTIVNRLSEFKYFDLIIVDEAHHSAAPSYQKILSDNSDAYILGVTATPKRLDGKGFEDLFDVLVCGITTSELIERGYLSPFQLLVAPKLMEVEGIKIINGDYSTKELASANNAVKLAGDLIETYQQHASLKRCLVFAINVEHSIAICDRYNQAGIRAAHLDGESHPNERKKVLEQFRLGEIKVLTNCQLFDEGLDIPALEAVQIARPTQSLSRWLQMVGRVLRPFEGKDFGIILDHTNNSARHGEPTRTRRWKLEGVEEIAHSENDFIGGGPRIGGEILEAQDTLVELNTSINWDVLYESLLARQKKLRYKEGWIYFRLQDLNAPPHIWERYKKDVGYGKGFVNAMRRKSLTSR